MQKLEKKLTEEVSTEKKNNQNAEKVEKRLIGIAVNRAVDSLPDQVANKIRENSANNFLTQGQVRLIKNEAANKLYELFELLGELNKEELNEYVFELAIETLSSEDEQAMIETCFINGSLNKHHESLINNRIEEIRNELNIA